MPSAYVHYGFARGAEHVPVEDELGRSAGPVRRPAGKGVVWSPHAAKILPGRMRRPKNAGGAVTARSARHREPNAIAHAVTPVPPDEGRRTAGFSRLAPRRGNDARGRKEPHPRYSRGSCTSARGTAAPQRGGSTLGRRSASAGGNERRYAHPHLQGIERCMLGVVIVERRPLPRPFLSCGYSRDRSRTGPDEALRQRRRRAPNQSRRVTSPTGRFGGGGAATPFPLGPFRCARAGRPRCHVCPQSQARDGRGAPGAVGRGTEGGRLPAPRNRFQEEKKEAAVGCNELRLSGGSSPGPPACPSTGRVRICRRCVSRVGPPKCRTGSGTKPEQKEKPIQAKRASLACLTETAGSALYRRPSTPAVVAIHRAHGPGGPYLISRIGGPPRFACWLAFVTPAFSRFAGERKGKRFVVVGVARRMMRRRSRRGFFFSCRPSPPFSRGG